MAKVESDNGNLDAKVNELMKTLTDHGLTDLEEPQDLVNK